MVFGGWMEKIHQCGIKRCWVVSRNPAIFNRNICFRFAGVGWHPLAVGSNFILLLIKTPICFVIPHTVGHIKKILMMLTRTQPDIWNQITNTHTEHTRQLYMLDLVLFVVSNTAAVLWKWNVAKTIRLLPFFLFCYCCSMLVYFARHGSFFHFSHWRKDKCE